MNGVPTGRISDRDDRQVIHVDDPLERDNLAESNLKLVETLSSRMDEFYKLMKRGKAPAVELDDEARRKLRSLGYVARGERSSSDDSE